MEYESVILKRLIDTYGVVGNPRYISEIIKEFIVQGKERFPNLFTYQADWLAHIDEFGLNPSYTVSYTGQSIYAPNTLEKPVKSAILKGQTLVNLWGTKREHFFTNGTFENSVLTSNGWCCLHRVEFFKPNTEYTLITNIISISDTNTYFKANNVASNGIFKTETNKLNKVGIYVEKVVSYDDFTGRQFSARSLVSGGGTIQFNMVVLEGDYTNVDIPYFEGMQSVKMPVLTTSNEDGTKTNILTVNEDVELRGIGDVKDTLDLMTGELTQRIGEVVLDGSSDERYAINGNPTATGLTLFLVNSIPNRKQRGKVISNLLPTINNYDSCGLFSGIGLNIVSNCSTVDELKIWLQQNPMTIQYELETESVKTVDLTILDQNGQNVKQLMSFNGGTHFNTGSFEGSPLPSVSVCVETDLEETLRVCSLDGNTM